MATIQFRRQLKFGHPKSEALKYIKTKLTLAAGEPLLCTYRETNGKFGAIEVICVYPKGTERSATGLNSAEYDNIFENGMLIENVIKNNADDAIWDKI